MGKTKEDINNLIRDSGLKLQFIEKQTPEICLEAVKQNGMAIRYVKEQTPKICLAAVRQNGHAMNFIEKQTDEGLLYGKDGDSGIIGYTRKEVLNL